MKIDLTITNSTSFLFTSSDTFQHKIASLDVLYRTSDEIIIWQNMSLILYKPVKIPAVIARTQNQGNSWGTIHL